jgi:hypothetical protein
MTDDDRVYYCLIYLGSRRFELNPQSIESEFAVDSLERDCLPLGGKGLMKKAHSRRLARLATGALVVLIVQCFCATRSAWAGCSHLVGSRSDRLDLERLDLLIVSGSSSLTTNDGAQSPQEPSVPTRPCSGLSCSSRDPLPISTAVPATGSLSDQCCALGTLVLPGSTSRSARTLEEPVPTSLGEPSSIFHPPRV